MLHTAAPNASTTAARPPVEPHVGLLDEEHDADLSVRAIDDVVDAARSGASIPPD